MLSRIMTENQKLQMAYKLIFEYVFDRGQVNIKDLYEYARQRYGEGGFKYRYLQWALGKLHKSGVLSRHRQGRRGKWYYEISTEFGLLIKQLYRRLREWGRIA